MLKIFTIGFVLALTVLATPASAQYTYTGTTVGGPTWNRPNANGNLAPTSLHAQATAVPYSVFQFAVTTTGAYTFQSTSLSPTSWDNYTFLYQTSFAAGSPLTNVVIGNDDNATIGLSGFAMSLTQGTTYFAVTTGAFNPVSGTFSNAINGPGVVTTPEPGTLGLLGLALLPCGAFLRRRRR